MFGIRVCTQLAIKTCSPVFDRRTGDDTKTQCPKFEQQAAITPKRYEIRCQLQLEIRSVERGICPIATSTINQSINQSTRIYIAPYVAGESEARTGLG